MEQLDMHKQKDLKEVQGEVQLINSYLVRLRSDERKRQNTHERQRYRIYYTIDGYII